MNEKQILALARKNAAKSAQVEKKRQRSFDATLDATRPTDEAEKGDAEEIFREMKKREF
ncbi:MAG: hypothetical protein WKG32_03640 [Gemmatimonadaceae bacterium]